MGKRLDKLKLTLQQKRERYKLEIKRQLIHTLNILFIIPMIIFPERTVIQIFVGAIGLAAFLHWYITRRRMREKYVKEFIKTLQLKPEERTGVMRSMKDVKKFEEWILKSAFSNFFRREESPLMSTLYFLTSTLFTLLIFGTPLAIIGLATLSIGDAFSTIIGRRWGKTKLLYNKGKSLQGTLAFFVTSFAALIVLFHFLPQYALISPIWLAFIAALSGALIETIPTIDDNITIPIGVAFILWLVLLLL